MIYIFSKNPFHCAKMHSKEQLKKQLPYYFILLKILTHISVSENQHSPPIVRWANEEPKVYGYMYRLVEGCLIELNELNEHNEYHHLFFELPSPKTCHRCEKWLMADGSIVKEGLSKHSVEDSYKHLLRK
ncbi:MAG: hypothetical protein AB7D38_12020 [Sulfurimonas sp.]|uniref:hypothetical protein n=1 Tax=Sulfurimonas sp. TaxID=2022749 RepID=UPI003D0F35CD